MSRLNIFLFLLFSLLTLPALAGDAEQPRPGNSRGYETDILLDTFGFSQDDIDAEIDHVFQGCAVQAWHSSGSWMARKLNSAFPDSCITTISSCMTAKRTRSGNR